MRAPTAPTDTVAPPTESTPSNTPGTTAPQHENEVAATHTESARAGTATLPALRTPPTTTGTDAPHTHLVSDDDDEMEDDSDWAPPHIEEGAVTPRTKLALLQKRLEFNIDDYDEIVDDDDVESVPAPHACMHPPICAARSGRITPAVRSRPPPLLRTHTDAVPLHSPPLRAGAHSCCLPVGVHMTVLRSVPFVQSQHGTLCLIHAFNNMLQLPLLRRPDMGPAFPPGPAREGNLHVHELHRALQYASERG